MTKRSAYLFPLFFLAASIVSLGAAYIAEYFFGLKPCALCLYQRVPYGVLIVVSLLSIILIKHYRIRNLINYGSVVIIVAGAGLAFYHMGVEYKWFEGLTTCSGQTAKAPQTLEEMRAQLLGSKPVRCDQPQFIFLTLSMAGWNMVWSLLLAAAGILMIRAERDEK